MDYIVIVLIFGIIGLYAWYAFKKPQIIEEINTSNKKQTETCTKNNLNTIHSFSPSNNTH